MEHQRPFSERHGYSPSDRDIVIRSDAPAELRAAILHIAVEDVNLTPTELRQIVCRVLLVMPDRDTWSVSDEVQGLLERAEWYKIYDIIERIHGHLQEHEPYHCDRFAHEVNKVFRERGIGWKLEDGMIEARGQDAIEDVVNQAKETLAAEGQATAAAELREARRDLSRMPEPDLTGAVQHAMAALECVAREATGDHRATLGDIIKRYPGLLPAPMDTAVEKMWGFASQVARHVQEGRTPDWEDAQAAVGLSAVGVLYLLGKLRRR